MREGDENEGLTRQTRLGKALNAKLRTTEFIMQNKQLRGTAGSKDPSCTILQGKLETGMGEQKRRCCCRNKA